MINFMKKRALLSLCMVLVLSNSMAYATEPATESLSSKISTFLKETTNKVNQQLSGVNIKAVCKLAGLIEYRPASLGYCLAFKNKNKALLDKLPAVASKIGTQTLEKLSQTMPADVVENLESLKKEYNHVIPTIKHQPQATANHEQKALVEKLLKAANYDTVKSLIQTGLYFASLQYANLLEVYNITLDPELTADIIHETTIDVLATSLTAHEISELTEFFGHETFKLIIKNRAIAIDLLIEQMPELAPLKMLAGS